MEGQVFYLGFLFRDAEVDLREGRALPDFSDMLGTAFQKSLITL